MKEKYHLETNKNISKIKNEKIIVIVTAEIILAMHIIIIINN